METPSLAVAAAPRRCRNCDNPLSGPYCSACGQHDVDYHRSFRHVCEDLLEGLFHFEGKFFVTVAWLFGWPGKLTNEFIAGRRQRQLNPLRFYLFVSVLFFLQQSIPSDRHAVESTTVEADGESVAEALGLQPATDASQANVPAAATATGHSATRDGAATHRTTAVTARHPRGAAGQGRLVFSPAPDLARSLSDKFASGELTWAEVFKTIEHRIPTVFFLGVPLFALLLKLAHLGSGRLYVEHLIFSLHLHTWAFLAMLVGGGYRQLAGFGPPWLGTLVWWAVFGWTCWYVPTAFRNVYPQRWRWTACKVGALAIAYGIVLLLLAVALTAIVLAWFAMT